MKLLNCWLYAVIVFLLIAVAANAQTIAVIDGPTSALPGELVVLSSLNSKGDNHKWISPAGLSTAQAGCEAIASQLFFATPREGSYEFYLIVSDKAAAIEYAKHTVVIKTPGSPIPPPVVNPPVDQPGSDFAKLTELSKANSMRLNDIATRAALSKNLKAVIAEMRSQCIAGQCPTLDGAKAKIVKTIEDTLLFRGRESRSAHWEEVWRAPNNQYISRLGITRVDIYLNAFSAVVAGLE